MREIRFRAWDEHNKTWVTDFQPTRAPSCAIMAGKLVCPSFWRVMQYTGLKDKNGKEIYEGDIVLADDGGEYFPQKWPDDPNDESEPVPTGKYQIIYAIDDGYPAYTLRNLDGTALDVESEMNPISWLHNEGSMEVIGNIYENPDLLKHES